MTKHKNVEYDLEVQARNRWLTSVFKQSWWRLVILVFGSLIAIGLQLLNPWPLKILVDSVFGDVSAPWILEPLSGTYALLVVVALSYVGLYLVSGLLDILDSYLTARFSGNLSRKQQKNFFFMY
jgi:ABC-type bacteriocin/lantibiotic exporter with double-glycine peptidase domain